MSDSSAEESIFHNALSFADPKARERYLEETCGADHELRARVRELLAGYEAVPFLASPTAVLDHTAQFIANDSRVGSMIGPYKLMEKVGEGGMGEVYVAEQSAPMRRKVAIKIIKPGMNSKQVVARFEAERQALAIMDHPNIAKVLDGGSTAEQLPYFVMELVRGLPITEYCDRAKLSTKQRLQLFIDVCAAVHHAHQKGIIHRDLKPSNILVTLNDGKPVAKVIDFGVAKALNQQLSQHTIYTALNQVIGTPLYMSPEQIDFSSLDIDTRSDIYSLGVLLYELVTGTTPFDRQRLQNSGFEELRRIIRDEEPPKPSKRISTLGQRELSTSASLRGLDNRAFASEVKSELDWIVLKTLEKDRNRRYETAGSLSSDIQNYLTGETVLACPPSLAYRTRKFARRNRTFLLVTGCVLVTALLGTAASLYYAFESRAFAVSALESKNEAERTSKENQRLARAAERDAQAAKEAEVRETDERKLTQRALYVSDIRLAQSLIQSNRHADAMYQLLKHSNDSSAVQQRPWEWYFLLGQSVQSEASWKVTSRELYAIDWSPDGELIATVAFDGCCNVYEVSTNKLLKSWPTSNILTSVRWSHDGKYLAWGSANSDQRVRIWDRELDSVEELPKVNGSVWSIQWSKDQESLLIGSIVGSKIAGTANNLKLVDLIDKQQRWETATENNITFAGWDRNESSIFVVTENAKLQIFDAASHVLKLERGFGYTLRHGHCSPTEDIVAIGLENGECVIYHPESDREAARFFAHFGAFHLEWSPDGKWLATCGDDGLVKLWKTSDWSNHQSYEGHNGGIAGIAWSPQSDRVVSCGRDGFVNIWTVNSASSIDSYNTIINSHNQSFTWLDNDRIQFIHAGDRLTNLNVQTGASTLVQTLPQYDGRWWHIGDCKAFCSKDYVIQGCIPESLNTVLVGKSSLSITIDARTDSIVSQSANNSQPRIYSPSNAVGTPVGDDPFAFCNDFQWSTRSRLLAIAGLGLASDGGFLQHAGWLYVADGDSGAVLRRRRIGNRRIGCSAVGWSPDEKYLAVGNRDGLCAVVQSTDLSEITSHSIHMAEVTNFAWHPTDERVASGGNDRMVQIWDAFTGDSLLSFNMDHAVAKIEWSPDGRKLCASDTYGNIKVWDSSGGHDFAASDIYKTRLSESAVR